MKRAMYAFSGDPITYGHIDIVQRAAAIFDRVVVGIGHNPDKNYMFTQTERTEMAKKVLSHLRNVKVVSFKGLLVDYAYENNIPVIIKGIRNNKDLDYEMLLHNLGDSQRLGIETFLIPARKELAHISSSTVKSLQSEQGLIHEFVPLYVKQLLEARMSGQYIIGVTGEIGAGKTYVSREIEKLGKKRGIEVHNIELDEIGHQILEKLKDPLYDNVRKDIIKAFGDSVKDKGGMINRKALGEIVFSDFEKLEKLNQLMKKPLLVRIRKELNGKKGLILFNAALIAESEMTHLCNNNVILVHSDKKTQQARLEKRKLTKEQIKRRLASQYSHKKKRDKINEQIKKHNYGKLWVIENSGKNVDKKIEKLLDEIIKYMEIKK